jgi:hypothetical protein
MKKSILYILTTIFIFCVTSCESKEEKLYKNGFSEGKQRAVEEIQNKDMTIYTKGKTDHRITHDKETGLKRYNLGCIITSY